MTGSIDNLKTMKKILLTLALLLPFVLLIDIDAQHIYAQEEVASPSIPSDPGQTETQINNRTSSATVSSNALCIQVGTPTGEKPAICSQQPTSQTSLVTGDSQGLARVLEWDETILSTLGTGLWGYYNKLLTNHTNGEYSTGTWPSTNEQNLYWCTYSIVDAYRLAGFGGLAKNGHGAVVYMRIFWKSPAAQELGYKYVDYESGSPSLASVQPGYAMFMESVAGSHTGREHVNMVKDIAIDSTGNGYLVTNDSNSSSKSHKYTVAGWRVLNTVYPVRGFGGI